MLIVRTDGMKMISMRDFCVDSKLIRDIDQLDSNPVGRVCRIHRLYLCRGVRQPLNECPVYDTKQSDDDTPVMLKLQGIRSTPLLALLPGPL